MYTELTGGYIRVGEDYDSEDKEKISFIYIDSTIQKECPFLMNAANYDGQNKFTKVCLEPATAQGREITIPDASGVVITNGNEGDIRSLPGLREVPGESVLQFRYDRLWNLAFTAFMPQNAGTRPCLGLIFVIHLQWQE